MKKNHLTLEERWAMDVEIAKAGGTLITSIPQCEICKYRIKENAMQCEKYIDRKPKETLRCKKECPKFQHEHILKIKPETKEMSQLLGAILGFAVADALGVPVEFSSREERQRDPVQEMRAYGTYHQFFGTWSDDSSMTFCLMDSLKDGYDLSDISDKFCRFYYENYWTPHNKVFDIGKTTVQAIEKIKIGMIPIECGGKSENDNGNGSLMRVLPLAFYLVDAPTKEKLRIIGDISLLTHAHKRSKVGCIIYVEYAINLIKGYNKYESYKNVKNFVAKNLQEDYADEIINYKNILKEDISNFQTCRCAFGFRHKQYMNPCQFIVSSLRLPCYTLYRTSVYYRARRGE